MRRNPLKRKTKLKKAKTTSKAKLAKRCDKLWSEIIRKRDKVCQKCGESKMLQASHIMPRTYRATRWDLENGKALCWKCHFTFWHKNPLEASEWFNAKFGATRMTQLRHRANNGIYPDRGSTGQIEGILAYLKEVSANVAG